MEGLRLAPPSEPVDGTAAIWKTACPWKLDGERNPSSTLFAAEDDRMPGSWAFKNECVYGDVPSWDTTDNSVSRRYDTSWIVSRGPVIEGPNPVDDAMERLDFRRPWWWIWPLPVWSDPGIEQHVKYKYVITAGILTNMYVPESARQDSDLSAGLTTRAVQSLWAHSVSDQTDRTRHRLTPTWKYGTKARHPIDPAGYIRLTSTQLHEYAC